MDSVKDVFIPDSRVFLIFKVRIFSLLFQTLVLPSQNYKRKYHYASKIKRGDQGLNLICDLFPMISRWTVKIRFLVCTNTLVYSIRHQSSILVPVWYPSISPVRYPQHGQTRRYVSIAKAGIKAISQNNNHEEKNIQ